MRACRALMANRPRRHAPLVDAAAAAHCCSVDMHGPELDDCEQDADGCGDDVNAEFCGCWCVAAVVVAADAAAEAGVDLPQLLLLAELP